MVTRILFDPRRDLPTGSTQSNPVTIEATPTGIREDGQVVVYPTTITFTITTGADILQLPPNTASNGWRLTTRDKVTSTILQIRVVRVPDQASIAYQTLPDIDPSSFQVTPGTARQWDATFWALVQAGAGGGLTDAGVASLIGVPTSYVAVALAATYLPFWKPNTAYVSGQRVVSPTGQTITANADFTSGATYVAGNWTVVAGGGGGTVSDATTSAKGIVQLGGDLGGTAAAPTVPGLASKATTAALTSGLAGKADLVGGVIPVAQIPAISIVDYLGPVANQAAMLALVGQKGDWATRTDLGTSWIITGSDPTQLASWTALSYPAAPVSSVAGRTGAVSLAKADVGLANVDNTADTAKPVSTAQAAADATKLDLLVAPVTLTASGTMTAGAWNLLDATSGPLTATLPTPTKIGQRLIAERQDAGTNLISFAGTVRGLTSGLPTFPGVGVRGESIDFEAESLTSWRIIASHKPKALLDQQFAAITAPAALDSATKSDVRRILTNGDSITAGNNFGDGTAWPTYLSGALGTGVTVTNIGQGGWTSTEVGILQGGIPVTLGAFTLLATTANNAVTVTAPTASLNAAGSGITFSASGNLVSGGTSYPGTLTRDAGGWRFNRSTAGSSVSIPAGAIFQSSAEDQYRDAVQTIAVGRNNPTGPVVADVAAMVGYLTPTLKRYLVIGVTTGSTETSGTANYNAITALNAQLAAIYGSRFLDVRRILIDSGMAMAGLTPTTADNTAIAADTLPPSLIITSDPNSAHPNSAAKAVIAQAILTRLSTLDWVKDKPGSIAYPPVPLPAADATFDAAALTVSTAVSSWNASTGTGNLNQGTAGARPTVVSNGGRNWVRFDGVDDELGSSSPLFAQPYTALFLIQPRSLTKAIGLMWPNGSGGYMRVETTGALTVFGGTSGVVTAAGLVTTTGNYAVGGVFNGASSLASVGAATPSTGSGGTLGMGSGFWRMGYTFPGADTWGSFDVAKIVIYSQALSATQLKQALTALVP